MCHLFAHQPQRGALLVARIAGAQMPLPAAKPPDGATLFKQQCATCDTTNLSDPARQGPSLFGIVGRPAGKVDGFHYSAGFAKADFAWDDARLDRLAGKPTGDDPGRYHGQPPAQCVRTRKTNADDGLSLVPMWQGWSPIH
jgi:cytochrome c